MRRAPRLGARVRATQHITYMIDEVQDLGQRDGALSGPYLIFIEHTSLQANREQQARQARGLWYSNSLVLPPGELLSSPDEGKGCYQLKSIKIRSKKRSSKAKSLHLQSSSSFLYPRRTFISLQV